MPQPFTNVGEATEAYITNLNTHPAYAGFRAERAACASAASARAAISLIGTLLRYSELGQDYVQFVRQIMRENELDRFRQGAAVELLSAYIIGRGRSASQTSG